MYESDPGQFLLWYYRRFAAYRHVSPNHVHRWLAAECNASTGGQPRGRLITQNIDGSTGVPAMLTMSASMGGWT